MKNRIRNIVSKEYGNTLGIVMYKDNEKGFEDYFSGADNGNL